MRRSARWAVAVAFAVHGAAFGSYAARLPWIQERLDLSPGALGLALLMMSVGAVGSMPFAGRVVHRMGSRAATRWFMIGWAGAIVLPALAPSLIALCVALLCCGLTAGTADVAMNAQGVAVEQRMGKSIMSGLHGMWSVGGLVGSAIGAVAAYRNIDARVHLGVMAVILAIAALLASFRLLPSRPTVSDKPPRFAFPTGPVLGIALVGFCAIFVEGSTADWCAVYLRQVTDAGAGLAAASYTLFALTMAAGRISGDVVVRRFGAVRTVRASGVVAVLGGVLVVFAGAPATAMIGFALYGLGVAVVVPLAFAAAGHAGPHSAHAIAGVATVSYGAGLAAPAAVGGIASLTSLPASFAVITALAAMISVGAGRLRSADAIKRV